MSLNPGRLNIGLLLTRNEVDVIEEVMAANMPHVDAVFAIDGSDDGTDRVLANYPQVKLLLRDEDVASDGRLRDYHRQALLVAAQERYGSDNWFTLMHGDEIFHNNPRKVIAAAEREGASRVNWAMMQFFLHHSDKDGPWDGPVQTRLSWYSPLWLEIRQFRATAKSAYRRQVHGVVVPDGVGWRPYSKVPLIKHYPYRHPEQVRKRHEDARSRGFSGTTHSSEVFRDTYNPCYQLARRFGGDFEELELDRQGNLLHMLWRWRRWTRRCGRRTRERP